MMIHLPHAPQRLDIFWKTCHLHIFVGPLIPLFWTSGDVSSGFQSQSWAALFVLSRGVYVTCSLRFTSGGIPTDLLVASIVAESFSTMYLQAGIGGARNHDLSCHYWLTVWDQADVLSTQLSFPSSYFSFSFQCDKFLPLLHCGEKIQDRLRCAVLWTKEENNKQWHV